MKKLLFILIIIPFFAVGQTKIRNTQLTSGNQPAGKVLKSDGATNVVWDNLAEKQDTITLTTSGTGAATFDGQTLNIPINSGAVSDTLKEDRSNKENTTVDNSTIKYPTINLLKTYADTKDPSSTNELNTSVIFNKTNNKIEITDAGGTKSDTIDINQDLLINGYSGTINVITNPVAFSWPVSYSDTNYYLDIFPHYTETIDGKSVLIRNAVYDFIKTTTGFSLKLDTLAGVVEYRASRTINSETPANVLLQSDLTTTVGSPGLDTKIPTEKAVRTALSGVVVTENDPVYSASSWFGTENNSTNWNTSYTDRLKWDGGSTGLTASTGRASLGATTIGSNLFTLTDPSTISFPRFNADNTVSSLSAADFKTAIGGGITNNSQIIKFDSGTTEGNDLYTFNGSATKTVDIKAGTNIAITKSSGTVTITASGGGLTYSFALSENLTQGKVVQLLENGTIEGIKIVSISQSIPAGSTYQISARSGYSTSVDFDPYDATKFVVVYSNASGGFAKVGTISGTTISFGSEYTIASTAGLCNVSFDRKTANKFIVAYNGSSTGVVKVGTISGTTISFGSEYTFSYGNVYALDIAYDPYNANKFCVVFRDYTYYNYGIARIGTVSGTTVTFGSITIFNMNYTPYVCMSFDPNTANSLIVAYINSANYGNVTVGTISSTSISFGSSYTVSTAASEYISADFDKKTANKFVVAYTYNSSAGYSSVGTVSGTSVSFGSNVTFYGAQVNSISVAFDYTTAGSFIISYLAGASSSGHAIIVGTMSGTTITYGSTSNLDTHYGSSPSVAFNVNKVGQFIGVETNTSTYINATLGQLASSAPNLSSKKLLGILQETGTTGQTKSVSLLGGIDSHQTGLTPNSLYYVTTDGSISTSSSNGVLIGKALSATTIQMVPIITQ